MPEDEELEKLRQEKMQELEEEETEEQQEALEDRIWTQAKQYMTDDARERLSNIRAADQEKALAVSRQIAMMGESGRMEKIDDDQMKKILKEINDQKKESDIKFRR